jgi:uroporphyrinogen-III synthase
LTAHAAEQRRPRVLLTRSEDDNAEWLPHFAAHGAEPAALPCIHCETLDTPTLRVALAAASLNADWLAFTSRRGVEAFVALGAQRHARARIAVVGAGTAAAAEHKFINTQCFWCRDTEHNQFCLGRKYTRNIKSQ